MANFEHANFQLNEDFYKDDKLDDLIYVLIKAPSEKVEVDYQTKEIYTNNGTRNRHYFNFLYTPYDAKSKKILKYFEDEYDHFLSVDNDHNQVLPLIPHELLINKYYDKLTESLCEIVDYNKITYKSEDEDGLRPIKDNIKSIKDNGEGLLILNIGYYLTKSNLKVKGIKLRLEY